MSGPEANPIRPLCVWKLKAAIKRLILDGSLLISTSANDKIRVWSINPLTGHITPEKTFKGHKGTPTKLVIHKSILLALSSHDSTLRSWNLQTLEPHKNFEGHEQHLSDLAVCEKEDIMYTSSFDNTIRSWNIMKGGKALNVFKGHSDSVTCVRVKGKHLFSASADKTVRIWLRKGGQNTNILHGHTNFVFGLHLHSDTIFSYSHDGTVRLWKMKTGELKHTIDVGYPVKSMKLQNKQLFTSAKSILESWSLKGKKLYTVEGHSGQILCNTWYGKKYLFTGGQDRTVRAWDLDNKGKQMLLFRGHEGMVNALELKDRWVFSGGEDCTIRLWPNPIFSKSEAKGWV
mmetsp:Transcript_9711/g.10757  ORF Transcript_9711/g.10757 Transcript_9711/m.10757 type:complete len:345 (+) Transcript_9711:80-1114(+)